MLQYFQILCGKLWIARSKLSLHQTYPRYPASRNFGFVYIMAQEPDLKGVFSMLSTGSQTVVVNCTLDQEHLSPRYQPLYRSISEVEQGMLPSWTESASKTARKARFGLRLCAESSLSKDERMYAAVGPKNFLASRIRERSLNANGGFMSPDDGEGRRLRSIAKDFRIIAPANKRHGSLNIKIGNVQICVPLQRELETVDQEDLGNIPFE